MEILFEMLHTRFGKGVEDKINNKVLYLIFREIECIWKKLPLYLFPYLKHAKSGNIFMEIKEKSQHGFENLMNVIKCYFTGTKTFCPKEHDNEK